MCLLTLQLPGRGFKNSKSRHGLVETENVIQLSDQ